MAQHSETRMVLFNAPGPFNMLAPLPGLVLSALLTSPSSPLYSHLISCAVLSGCLPPCLAHNSIVNALFWRVSRFSVATDLYMSPPTDYTIVHIL